MVNLQSRRVLVVEDEFTLAEELRTALEQASAIVIGPEPSVQRALDRVQQVAEIDAAILDVNLDGEMVFPVAEALQARRVPFLFATGYRDEVARARFPDAIQCDKPLNIERLLATLRSIIRK